MLLLFQWNMGQDARKIGSVSRTTESAILLIFHIQIIAHFQLMWIQASLHSPSFGSVPSGKLT